MNTLKRKLPKYAFLTITTLASTVVICTFLALFAIWIRARTVLQIQRQAIAHREQLEREAWQHAQNEIRKKVDHTGSAQFGNQGDNLADHVQPMQENEFLATGWVDYETHQGERETKEWMVGMKHTADGKWEVEGVMFKDPLKGWE